MNTKRILIFSLFIYQALISQLWAGDYAVKADIGSVTAPMQIVSSLDAPGGSYIQSTISNSGSAVFNVNIVQPGTYKIEADVYAADNSSDSFAVKIDNGTADIWDLNPSSDPALYNVWRQDEVTTRGTGTFDAPQFDPLTVQLDAGPHTITFSGREPNAKLADAYFTMVSPAVPPPHRKTPLCCLKLTRGH